MSRFLCVTDFEATCWENHKAPAPGGGWVEPPMEIIEMGCVLADAETLKKVSEFQTFVRPVRTTTLSDFCMFLTTIRQEDVDRAPEFPEALTVWMRWLDGLVQRSEVTFASWGRYDYNQLTQDCQYHGVKFPFWTEHTNLKTAVAEKKGWKPQGVGKALRRLGLEFEGTAHRGLDDAKNILRIAQKVLL
jgi:inhibitor of KinA sporulation pathway (predicted exonuclease)